MRKLILPILATLISGVVLADARQIVLYPGYGADRFVVEGRVIEARQDRPEAEQDSWLTNLKRTLRRLINDEQKQVALRIRLGTGEWRAQSDAEGYFRVDSAFPAGVAAGWQAIEAATDTNEARSGGFVLRVPAENRFGLITDLDDTILISEVLDKSQLLKKTLLENYAQRQAVPGSADFFTRLARRNLQPAAAPIFYLSASPKQLATGIQTFLDRNRFPRGVLITRKITNDQTGDSLTDTQRYKIARIEQILAALPDVRFVLVGDDGEHDPEIYHEIQQRFPQRVEAVWIRKVNPDAKRPTYAGQRDLAAALAGAGTNNSE